MKSLKERIAIEQAYSDGGKVQYIRLRKDREWLDLKDNREAVVFEWNNFDYRVKPEPREFWINTYDNGATSSHQSVPEAVATNSYGVAKIETIKVREVTE